jgi:hypothetical protein
MKTNLTRNNQFEVIALKDDVKQWVPIFENDVYISQMKYPIGDKNFRVVGLGGEVQDAFYATFNTDMLLLRNENEVKQALEQVIITMGYKYKGIEVIQ